MAEIFDSLAYRYDRWYETDLGRLAHEAERQLVMELLRPRAGQRVLDFGCGTGNYTLELAGMGLAATGMDISAAMLAVAGKKGEQRGLQVDWLEGDVHNLPFVDGTFDLALSVTALEFFHDPGRALREAYRVLKPGGRLVVGVIGNESPWSRLYQERAAREPDSVFRHARFYTTAELLALMPEHPGLARGALYFPPRQDLDRESLLAMEAEGREKQGPGAGFVAALWIKG